MPDELVGTYLEVVKTPGSKADSEQREGGGREGAVEISSCVRVLI